MSPLVLLMSGMVGLAVALALYTIGVLQPDHRPRAARAFRILGWIALSVAAILLILGAVS